MTRVIPAILFLALVLGTVSAPTASAQSEPEPPKNLQYFPKDMARDELIAHMRDFSFALGAEAHLALGEVEEARKLYEEILADRPRDGRVRARLEELRAVEEQDP